MKRVAWLAAASLGLVACGANSETIVYRDAPSPVGGSTGVAIAPASAGTATTAGAATTAGTAGVLDSEPGGAAGAAPVGMGGAASGGTAGEQVAAGAFAGGGTGGGGHGGLGAGGGQTGGAAGAPVVGPGCEASNTHPLPASCAGPQPVNCALGISDNPNMCTGVGVCPDDGGKECRPFEEDFALCKDGRFRSSPLGTCGTADGPTIMESQPGVPKFCPCVVMGVASPKP